ncbi:hypothetical protein GCM10009720_25560 [Yaniella flava]|uniref:Acetyltransferase n=1 Tax=Yaniella flava TaxID=287930 RepID=A0ABN2UUY5_9MICC
MQVTQATNNRPPRRGLRRYIKKAGEIAFNSFIAKLPNRGFRNLRVMALRSLGAQVGQEVRLSRNIKILGAEHLVLEDKVSIANSVLLDARAGLRIEEGALIGFESIVLTYTHAWPDPKTPVQFQGAIGKSLTIGSLSWLGMRVMVLPGANIGRASVVGAGAVVTKDIPNQVVAAGNPCEVRNERLDRTN